MCLPTPAARRTDDGSAMIMTLMVMMLLTVLGTTVAVVTVGNLQSSWRAQQAAAALNAADAGLAQTMSHLRTAGVRDLACTEPGQTCATPPLGSKQRPLRRAVPGVAGQEYEAWVVAVAPFPANDPGKYELHSKGIAEGEAARTVITEVTVTDTGVPRGIFAKTVNGGGSASVTNQSVFSTGCVYDRSKIDITPSLDLAYGIPAGVHTSAYITDGHGTNKNCSANDKKLIHDKGTCNPTYPFDHDLLGGPLDDPACKAKWDALHPAPAFEDYFGVRDLDGDGAPDVQGSRINSAQALMDLFEIPTELAPLQIEQLRTVAQSQGNLITSSSGWSVPDEDNAVVFFDLDEQADSGAARTVDLNPFRGSRFDPTTWGSTCETRSLTIVVEGGNVKFNSNLGLAASLFLTSTDPYGEVLRANGTANFVGSIYADTINLVGNVDIALTECFLANTSPSLLAFESGSYREDDRGLS